MCKPPKPKTPDVVQRDPVAEATEAANRGQALANAELAQKRKRRQQSSLLSMGAQGYTGPAASTLLAAAQPGGA